MAAPISRTCRDLYVPYARCRADACAERQAARRARQAPDRATPRRSARFSRTRVERTTGGLSADGGAQQRHDGARRQEDRRDRRHPADRSVGDGAAMLTLGDAVFSRPCRAGDQRRRCALAAAGVRRRFPFRQRSPPPAIGAAGLHLLIDFASGQGIVAAECRRAARARVAHQADDGVPRCSRALRDKHDHAVADGAPCRRRHGAPKARGCSSSRDARSRSTSCCAG